MPTAWWTVRVGGGSATSKEVTRLGTWEAAILGWKHGEGAGVFIGHRRGWHGTMTAALRCSDSRVCGGTGVANAELGWAEVTKMRG
jgi:hypothetical protein